MDYVYKSTLSSPPESAIPRSTPLTWSYGIDSILIVPIILTIWQPTINDQQGNNIKGKKYEKPVAQPGEHDVKW